MIHNGKLMNSSRIGGLDFPPEIKDDFRLEIFQFYEWLNGTIIELLGFVIVILFVIRYESAFQFVIAMKLIQLAPVICRHVFQ